jgi:outer membrane receptor protein involved in Fe transport
VTTPRLGVVWSPVKTVDFFANIGEGFRSPAERELSPAGTAGPLGAAGGQAFPDLKPPKVKAHDYGVNAMLGQQWKVSASRYHTLNQNEIRETTPGSGVYAGVGDTTRDGWEIEATFFATDALSLYGSVGKVKGRVNNPANRGQVLISGLPEYTYRLGFEYGLAATGGQWSINGDAFQISGAPYYSGTNPDPLYSRTYSRYDLRVSFEQGKVRYTAYGTFQPRDYAGEQAGATIDPRPKRDLGIAIAYKF